MTVSSIFEKTVDKKPEQVALVFGDHKIEYGLLRESINRLAQGLLDLGIQKGDRIALMLPNVPHFCISYYAILKLGAVVVPINIMYDNNNIKHILLDCGAKVIITWVGFKSQVINAVKEAPQCERIIFLGNRIPSDTTALTTLIAKSAPIDRDAEVTGEDLAVINYTSGVADVALGAALTHEAMIANAMTCREMFLITSEDKCIAVLPLFHPLGQTLVMNASFFIGATAVLVPRFSPEGTIDLVQKNGVTLMAAVPGMFQGLVETDVESGAMPTLKYCICYGGTLSKSLSQAFENKFDSLVLQAFGLTEAGPLVTANRTDRDRKVDSVGLPLVGVDVRIQDETGAHLLPKQSGEIWIKSPSLMKFYYNNGEQTDKRLKDGWLFSGDIGYLDEDYYLFIQERKEDIIVKGGFHIFPTEIERLLLSHPAVAEAAVVGVADSIQGAEVKAFVVLKKDQSVKAEELFAFCSESLPVYKSPKFIEFVHNLPKSSTGRVLKRMLRITGEKTNRDKTHN